MTAVPPSVPEPPSGSSDATVRALASIDLTGGDEAPVVAFGRIVGGLILLILGGVGAIALFVGHVAGPFIPAVSDWAELVGDGLLYAAIIAFAIAVTGFELLRRGRKARKAEAAQAADIISRLGSVGALDGTASAADIENALSGPRTGDMDAETQLPVNPNHTDTHL